MPTVVTERMSRLLGEGVGAIGITLRTANALEEIGVLTVWDLLSCTQDKLMSVPNIGDKTLEEIYSALAEHGFHREGHEPSEESKTDQTTKRRMSMRDYFETHT